MKKILITAIALLAMASCAVVDKSMTAGECSRAKKSGNKTEELVSLINGYTAKINAVESVYDLFFISEKCYKDKMAFEKNYAEEVTAENETIKGAMDKFEEAVNKKAKTLADEQSAAEGNAQKRK